MRYRTKQKQQCKIILLKIESQKLKIFKNCAQFSPEPKPICKMMCSQLLAKKRKSCNRNLLHARLFSRGCVKTFKFSRCTILHYCSDNGRISVCVFRRATNVSYGHHSSPCFVCER